MTTETAKEIVERLRYISDIVEKEYSVYGSPAHIRESKLPVQETLGGMKEIYSKALFQERQCEVVRSLGYTDAFIEGLLNVLQFLVDHQSEESQ